MAPPSEINAIEFYVPSIDVRTLQHLQQTLQRDFIKERPYLLQDITCFLSYISSTNQRTHARQWSTHLSRKKTFMFGPTTWLDWFRQLDFEQQQTAIQELWSIIESSHTTIQEKENQAIHTLYRLRFPRGTKLTRLETEVLEIAIKEQNISASELAKLMNKSTQLMSRTLKRLQEKNYMQVLLEPIYPKFNLQTYVFIIEHDPEFQPAITNWGIGEDWLVQAYQSLDQNHDVIEMVLPSRRESTYDVMKWINQVEALPTVERVMDIETFPFGELSQVSIIPQAFHKINEWEGLENKENAEPLVMNLRATDEASFDVKLEDPIVRKGIDLLLKEGYLPIRLIEQRLNLSYRNAKSLRSFILEKFISMLILPGTNYPVSLYYLVMDTGKQEHEQLFKELVNKIPYQHVYRGKGQGHFTIGKLYYESYKKEKLLSWLEQEFDNRISLIEIPLPPYPTAYNKIPFHRLKEGFSWDITGEDEVVYKEET